MSTVRSTLAGAGDHLVRIHRTVSTEPLEGFVVGIGRAWLLLQSVDDAGSLDGYSLVRVAQVAEVERCSGSDRFVRKWLEISHDWPPRATAWPLSLDRTNHLIAVLSKRAGAIAIYIEKEDPGVLFLGVPFLFKKKVLGLREIDSGGCWHEELSQWSFKRLTRIDFEGRYEKRMLKVAELSEKADG